MREDSNNESVTLDELIYAVNSEEGREPNWAFVDKYKHRITNNETTRKWVFSSGCKAELSSERDLAMTLVEVGDYELTDEEKVLVEGMLVDENKYVRFRAAFSLYKRGDRSSTVVELMKIALEDDEVMKEASVYLNT